jgi:hypothetical protein
VDPQATVSKCRGEQNSWSTCQTFFVARRVNELAVVKESVTADSIWHVGSSV